MIAVVFLQPPEIHCMCSVRKTRPVSSPNFVPESLEIMMSVLAFLVPVFRTVTPGSGKNNRQNSTVNWTFWRNLNFQFLEVENVKPVIAN